MLERRYLELIRLFDRIELLEELDRLHSLLFLGMQGIDFAKSFNKICSLICLNGLFLM
jgi:hypothetical protein